MLALEVEEGNRETESTSVAVDEAAIEEVLRADGGWGSRDD